MLSFLIDDIKRKGGPAWLVTLVIGIALGFAAGVVFYKNQLEAADQQVKLFESQREHAKEQQKQAEARLAKLGQVADTAQSCDATKAIITTQQREIGTLATWNEQWRTANANLVAERDQYAAQANIVRRIDNLAADKSRVAANIFNLTGVRCKDDEQGSCDLIPIAQRQLKALEVEKEQLQAQILTLEGKLHCLK